MLGFEVLMSKLPNNHHSVNYTITEGELGIAIA